MLLVLEFVGQLMHELDIFKFNLLKVLAVNTR